MHAVFVTKNTEKYLDTKVFRTMIFTGEPKL